MILKKFKRELPFNPDISLPITYLKARKSVSQRDTHISLELFSRFIPIGFLRGNPQRKIWEQGEFGLGYLIPDSFSLRFLSLAYHLISISLLYVSVSSLTPPAQKQKLSPLVTLVYFSCHSSSLLCSTYHLINSLLQHKTFEISES